MMGKQLVKLVEDSLKTKMDIDRVIADTAYSGRDNLNHLKTEEIQAVIPLHPIVHNGGQKQEGFQYNKDADLVLCPAGERNIRKAVQGSKKKGQSRSLVFYFDVDKCKTCPLQEGCYKPGSKSKTYSIRLLADQYKTHMEFEATDEFKAWMKRRPIIEHKNAELKRYLGLTRAKYRGLFRMRIQTFLTVFAANVKRMVKLIDKKQPTS